MSAYDRGYAWALSNLAEKKMSVEDIQKYIDNPFTEGHPFDRGAARAISDYIRIKTEEVYDDPV